MNPLISIIVPIYNIQNYINVCIDSILNQTYNNIEVILVDDGANDESPKICDEYAAEDSRVIVIHKENGGLSSARNAGIDAARGEYLMFVDGDDSIDKSMCESLYKQIRENKCDMAVSSINNVDEAGEGIDKMNCESPVLNGVMSRDDYFEKMLGAGYWYWVVAWNKLYKRELFNDIRYPVGKLHEDEFTIHRIVFKCNKIAATEDRLYNHIKHGGSIMNKKYSVKRLDVIDAFFEREIFFIDKEIPKNTVVKNFYRCTCELANTYQKADLKDKAYRAKYRDLHRQYRKIAKRVFHYPMPFLYRAYFALNYVSPYFVWKVMTPLRIKQNRGTINEEK